MSNDDRNDDHLADVEDGCGCAEVWEHLSARRGGGAPDHERPARTGD